MHIHSYNNHTYVIRVRRNDVRNELECIILSGRVSLAPDVVEVALANMTHKVLAYNLRITYTPPAVD